MDVEKGCLNRCDNLLDRGCDSVSYDDFFTVSWKMEHEMSRDLCCIVLQI